MHPPLFLLMRTVLEDVNFKGYTIEKGKSSAPQRAALNADFGFLILYVRY